MTAPRYQDVTAEAIPTVVDDDGTAVRVVCGSFWGQRGPVDGIAADPTYLDVSVPAGRTARLPVETHRHAFAYVFAGAESSHGASSPQAVRTDPIGPEHLDDPPYVAAGDRSLILFDRRR